MPPHSRDFSHELGGNYKKIINFIFSDNPSEKINHFSIWYNEHK